MELARRLIKDGPTKRLTAAPRRIRLLFNGVYIAETRRAVYIWEHPYYPQLYLPWEAFSVHVSRRSEPRGEPFDVLELDIGGKKTDLVRFVSNEVREELRGLVKVNFKAMGKTQ